MDVNRNGFTALEKIIAGEVRAEMARRGFRQSDVSAAIGMHPNVFGRKYRGNVGFTSSELASIAAFLGTTAAAITEEAERRLTKEKTAA